MTDHLNEVFGAGGLLARRFPGYEAREGQVALARTVDLAMRDGRHALGEGPCGTGKGVAYGVPAVWHAHHRKKRVVIATANIALQEQLIRKDLPLLASVLPWPFTFALLKGRNNYLCIDATAEAEARGELAGMMRDDLDQKMDEIRAWAAATATGDVSELSFVPAPIVWSRFSVGSDDCKGDACPFRDRCFSERAKATAAEADIVVTNFHLLFAHLALRRETGMDLVLPPFDLLLLDEAHELADVARDFFGFKVSERSVTRLARFAERRRNEPLAAWLRRDAEELFADLAAVARSPGYRCRLRKPDFVSPAGVLGALAEVARIAGAIADDEGLEPAERAEGRNVRRQAQTVAAHIVEGTTLSDPNKVYWIELDPKGRARLGAKPVEVAELLREELFERTESVTLVSATLTTAGTFDFVRAEVGVPDGAIEVVAESPFDFRRQALLIVPDGLPDPREPDYIEAAADAVQKVIDHCDGRTLGLFTSYRNMNAVHERVSGNGHRVMRQGDMPRSELTRLFKEDVGSVLLKTESFWTGIDVPGEALTGLVIDKLPFPNMDDPIIDAICARDRQAFGNYLVPRAIIMLRQGVGRLIRSQSDIGVVVILDRRIADKAYGKRFLRSLPNMLTSRSLESIPRFLEEAAHARTG
jgi:ATP-dependent DNA helicase DinG